jgi:hypothetical protein
MYPSLYLRLNQLDDLIVVGFLPLDAKIAVAGKQKGARADHPIGSSGIGGLASLNQAGPETIEHPAIRKNGPKRGGAIPMR